MLGIRLSGFWIALLVAATLVSAGVMAADSGQGDEGDGGIALAAITGRIHSIKNLPGGQARLAIQRLRTSARERALKALNNSALSMSDLDDLQVDRHGGLIVVEPLTTDDSTEIDAVGPDTASAQLLTEPAADPFALHSKPGSTNLLFLDFDGHDIMNTRWNGMKTAEFRATAFSLDDDFSSFSHRERAAISQIWYRVAAAYSAFNIDITTQDPGSFGPTVGRVLITSHQDLDGRVMPFSDAAGAAYVGVWGAASYPVSSPALVYYNRLAARTIDIAEAVMHGLGHNLGLGNQGRIGEEPLRKPFGSWRELKVIADQLGLRQDDHASETAAATALQVAVDGTLVAVNPATDSMTSATANRGVIEVVGDVDTFAFTSLGGPVELVVSPAWQRLAGESNRDGNSGIKMALLDEDGKKRISDSADNHNQFIASELPAGPYYLQVSGIGINSGAGVGMDKAPSPHSGYPGLGQYLISGNILPPVDQSPPSPNPMGWSIPPKAISKTTLAMNALTATDSAGVEYQFSCSTTGPGCQSSDWQTSPDYLATALKPATRYSFQVRARSGRGKVTKPSPSASATTATNRPPVAQADDAGTVASGASKQIKVLSNDRDPDGDSLTIVGVEQAVHGVVAVSGNRLTYSAGNHQQGRDSFEYTISDSDGATAKAKISLRVLAANQPPLAANDAVAARTGLSTRVNVLDNDKDPEGTRLTLVSVDGASHGVVTIDGSALSYRSDNDYSGPDQFSYEVKDRNGATARALVSVTVSLSNRSPVAVDDFVTSGVSGIEIEILANDSDANGDEMTVIWVSLAENGTVSLDGSVITYVPNSGFLGNDSFDYQIEDPEGESDIATVTVVVEG